MHRVDAPHNTQVGGNNLMLNARHMTLSPLFSATEEALLTRLEWMAIQPKIILYAGYLSTGGIENLQARYPDAVITTTTPHPADLIVAHLYAPLQQDMQTQLQAWRRQLTPNGLLIFSALGLDTLQEYREHLPCPFLMDMHDLGDGLIHAGLVDPVLEVEHYELSYHHLESLLGDLTALNFIQPETAHLPAHNNTWSATYEMVYGHAFAPLTATFSRGEGGVTRIPLAALKPMKKTSNDG